MLFLSNRVDRIRSIRIYIYIYIHVENIFLSIRIYDICPRFFLFEFCPRSPNLVLSLSRSLSSESFDRRALELTLSLVSLFVKIYSRALRSMFSVRFTNACQTHVTSQAWRQALFGLLTLVTRPIT